MKKTMALAVLLAAAGAMAAPIYDMTFDPAPTVVEDFNITLGGVNFPTNFKEVQFGEWGRTVNGAVMNIGGANQNVLRPQSRPANNLKLAGVFLDPALFSGAGTYTVRFDVLGDAGGNAVARALVYQGAGYDLTGATDAKLNMNLSANGWLPENGYTGVTGVNGATVSAPVVEVFNPKNTQTVSFDFTYDGSSAVALTLGAYNSAFQMDNLQVIPEPATIGLVSLFGAGILAARRMKM